MSIHKALLAVQGELHGVVRDSTNPHFKNRYASLEAVIETVRPSLQKHGVVFVQLPGSFANGVIELTTVLTHAESGESVTASIGLPVAKQDPQGVGSAITYASRYSLMAMLGLPPVDDDAQSASVPTPKTGTKLVKDEEWGDPAAVKVYRMLAETIRNFVTQQSDVFEFKQKNSGMIATLPVKMRKHLEDTLARVGAEPETEKTEEAA